LAAGAVLCYHFYFIGPLQGFWPKSIFLPWAHWGDLGVDLFFVISGFVITLTSDNRGAGDFKSQGNPPCTRIRRLQTLPHDGHHVARRQCHGNPDPLARQPDVSHACSGSNRSLRFYWTLAVEIHFYGVVALLMALGVWKRHNDLILWIWLVCAFIVQYFDGPGWRKP
jgi:peptidoglycan/LPS O-acetylase OafA/YrhL